MTRRGLTLGGAVFVALAPAGRAAAQTPAPRPPAPAVVEPPARGGQRLMDSVVARAAASGVVAARDLVYARPGGRELKLDLYARPAAGPPAPLILWVHGGAWSSGHKGEFKNGLYVALQLLEQGYAVASIDYRLRNEAKFPAQIEDTKAAVRWLRANAARYNLDPARVVAFGSSAGAYLAELAGTAGDVRAWDVGDHLDQSSAVQAVVDWFGPVDFVTLNDPPRGNRPPDRTPEAELLGGPVLQNLDKARRANPVTYVGRGDPPFLIMHGLADSTISYRQSELLYAALRRAGVPATLRLLPGLKHGGPEWDHFAPQVREFLAEHLRPARDRRAGGVPAARTSVTTVGKWSVHEVHLEAARAYDNPYLQAAVTATFTGPGGVTRTVDGFWDGGRAFAVRFAPTAEGRWTYRTRSADAGLDGRTGELRVTAPAPGRHGFVRRDAEHPHAWVYDDGTRYLMLGTTYYQLISTALAGEAWRTSVDSSAAYGVTKVRLRINQKQCEKPGINPNPCSSPYGANGADHDRLNVAHFRAADRVVAHMDARGVVADLMPFDSSNEFYGTDAQDERYLRYVLARYGAYPNVIWCLANEYMAARSKTVAFWNRVGAVVRAADPFFARGAYLRPLSIHCCGSNTGGDSRTFFFYDQPWPVHVILQESRRLPGDVMQKSVVANLGHDMPVVDDEFGYMGDGLGAWGREGYSRDEHRRALWAIYAAGGSASTGDKFEYPDGRPYHSGFWHSRPEYGDLKRLHDFFSGGGVAYWRMTSRDELARGERVYVLAEPGRRYVAYAAAGGAFGLDLAPGRYAARRYDPRTGEDVTLGTLDGGGVRPFETPAGRDWVVYLLPAAR